MRKTFLSFSLVGMAVAGGLVQYAYSNHHQSARLEAYVYLIACPSSILLVATESVSALREVFIIALVVGLNGVFYGTVAIIFRQMRT